MIVCDETKKSSPNRNDTLFFLIFKSPKVFFTLSWALKAQIDMFQMVRPMGFSWLRNPTEIWSSHGG
jgi:hypothetical protein